MASREYQTRITIDGDGSAAVAEFDRVGAAAREVDSEIDQIDGRRINVDTSGAVSDIDRVDSAIDEAQRNASDGIDVAGGEAGGGVDLLVGKLGAAKLGAAGIATGLYAAVDAAAENTRNAAILSEALGLSLTEASLLENVFEDLGVDTAGVYGLMEQFNDALANSPELADELGIAMGPDGVLDPVEALGAAIDNWDLLTPTERMELFGEEGVLAISRMRASGRTLEEAMNDIADIRITSQEDLDNLAEYEEIVREIKNLWQSIVVSIGGDVIETIKNLKDPVSFVKDEVKEIGKQLGLVGDDQSENIAKMNEFAQASSRATDELNEATVASDGLVNSVELIPNEVPINVRWSVDNPPPGFSYPARPGSAGTRVYAGAGAAATASAVPRNTIAPATNITINVARTTSMRDVSRAVERWSRINGRPATDFRQSDAT